MGMTLAQHCNLSALTTVAAHTPACMQVLHTHAVQALASCWPVSTLTMVPVNNWYWPLAEKALVLCSLV